jgi:hypothetical protein
MVVSSYVLAVLECANELKKTGETLVEVKCFDEIRAEPSGGTLDTVFHSLQGRVQVKASLGFDPMIKTTSGQKSNNKTVITTTTHTHTY